MIRNKNNIYADDLHGYDGLYRFSDVFPTMDEWVKGMNEYLFDFELSIEDEQDRKVFNILLSRYKNNFFRWMNISTIYSKMANEYTRLKRLLARQEVYQDLYNVTGTTTTVENFKTNNTANEEDPENQTKYRTDIETTFVDNSDLYLEKIDEIVSTGDIVNTWVDSIKTNFMNRSDEVVIKEGIYTKG